MSWQTIAEAKGMYRVSFVCSFILLLSSQIWLSILPTRWRFLPLQFFSFFHKWFRQPLLGWCAKRSYVKTTLICLCTPNSKAGRKMQLDTCLPIMFIFVIICFIFGGFWWFWNWFIRSQFVCFFILFRLRILLHFKHFVFRSTPSYLKHAYI